MAKATKLLCAAVRTVTHSAIIAFAFVAVVAASQGQVRGAVAAAAIGLTAAGIYFLTPDNTEETTDGNTDIS